MYPPIAGKYPQAESPFTLRSVDGGRCLRVLGSGATLRSREHKSELLRFVRDPSLFTAVTGLEGLLGRDRIRRAEVYLEMWRSEAPYVVMTAECRHCKTKQTVHVAARTGVGMIGNQTIRCINCDHQFDAMLPDKIVGGPFPTR